MITQKAIKEILIDNIQMTCVDWDKYEIDGDSYDEAAEKLAALIEKQSGQPEKPSCDSNLIAETSANVVANRAIAADLKELMDAWTKAESMIKAQYPDLDEYELYQCTRIAIEMALGIYKGDVPS